MRRLSPQLLASIPHARLRGTAPVHSPVSSVLSTPTPSLSTASRRLWNWSGPASRPGSWHKQPLSLQWQQQRADLLTTSKPLFANNTSSNPPSSTGGPATAEPPPSSSAEPAHISNPPAPDGSESLLPPTRELDHSAFPKLPFRFDTGVALFAKRTPRPFPPPFLSPPSGSFSDPLSTHDRSRDRRAYVNGNLIQGYTNGDDAVFASDYFICANDGVGAWSTRPRGHAGLWARLILHFWVTAILEDAVRQGEAYQPNPIAYLQRAYEQTKEATSSPNDWQGTTTASGAQLHYQRKEDSGGEGEVEPLLYVTNVGDSQVMVVRPSTRELIFKSTEQWHWFDCPRQLGTNSPDTPEKTAVLDAVPIREGDVVLAMSDGVIDNLWSHEIVENVSDSVEKWQSGKAREHSFATDSGMGFVAQELMVAAKTIACDPFAESPFMEHAIEEGLASEGGKLDDISVVAGVCKKNGP